VSFLRIGDSTLEAQQRRSLPVVGRSSGWRPGPYSEATARTEALDRVLSTAAARRDTIAPMGCVVGLVARNSCISKYLLCRLQTREALDRHVDVGVPGGLEIRQAGLVSGLGHRLSAPPANRPRRAYRCAVRTARFGHGSDMVVKVTPKSHSRGRFDDVLQRLSERVRRPTVRPLPA
jgi:hypothetical protein